MTWLDVFRMFVTLLLNEMSHEQLQGELTAAAVARAEAIGDAAEAAKLAAVAAKHAAGG